MTPQNDFFRDTALALSLLTRLPIKLDDAEYTRSASAAWAYPVVGLVTGLGTCAIIQIALWLGLPLWSVAIIALVTTILLTGAMHEDGLADCADGFWGGWDPAMRLKIMKDSHLGTYGMLVLMIAFGLRFGATLELLRWDNWVVPLIAIHVASRSFMPVMMSYLPHARETGLSRSVGNVTSRTALYAFIIGCSALLVAFGGYAIVLALITALIAFGFAMLARAKIGGQTGDVCGATQQITEITLLLTLLAG